MKMMPVAALGVCLIGLLPLPVRAQATKQAVAATAPEVPPAEVTALFPPSPEWEKIEGQLNRPIGDFKVDKLPLEAALNKWHELAHLDIYVNWAAITGAGEDRNVPATVDLRDAPARRALAALLASAGGPTANLDFTIHDGTVCISTVDDLQSEKYQVVRGYDIDPLVQWEIKNRGVSTDEAIKEIISMITSTVAAGTWRDNGGIVGSLREINRVLYINQTQKTQEAIRQLLISVAVKAIPVTRVYDVRALVADPDKVKNAQRLMDLKGLILDHCPPDTWGNYRAMTARNGFLIITACAPAQEQIAKLLALVRETDAQSGSPPNKGNE